MLGRKQRRIDYLEDQIIGNCAEAERWEGNYRELINTLNEENPASNCRPDQEWVQRIVREHMSRLPAGS